MIFKKWFYVDINTRCSFTIPSFSDIINISFDPDNRTALVTYTNYEISDLIDTTNHDKLVNIWITCDSTLLNPPNSDYKFFKIEEIKNSEINLSRTNNGIVNVVEHKHTYYIFLEMFKTISEERDIKINKITGSIYNI
jgi:hypothetical protein